MDVLATPADQSTGGSAGAGTSAQAALPVGRALVVSVSSPPGAPGTVVVELQVSQDAMPQVAAAAATGQIDLAAVPASGGQ